MIDPEKLLASATRLYGDQMDALWGAFLPVPASQVTVLTGGERLDVSGTSMQVAYTPGHAKHHVSYLDERSGMAYVGDTAGIRIIGDYLLAPTPPPDIDIEAWQASLDVIDAWQPVSLFLTHFGPITPARAHLARFRTTLTAQAEMVRDALKAGGSEEQQIRAFVDRMRQDARQALPEREAKATELAAPFDQLWQGLARYWQEEGLLPRPRARSARCAPPRPACSARPGSAARSPTGSPSSGGRARRATPRTGRGPRAGATAAARRTGRPLDLQVHQAVERNRRAGLTFHEHPEVADVPRHDRRKPDGPRRVLPGEPGRHADVAAFRHALTLLDGSMIGHSYSPGFVKLHRCFNLLQCQSTLQVPRRNCASRFGLKWWPKCVRKVLSGLS